MLRLLTLALVSTAIAAQAPPPPPNGPGQTSQPINQDCIKACLPVPEDQRETCYHICVQFVDQGVSFTAVSMHPTSAHQGTATSSPTPTQDLGKSGHNKGDAEPTSSTKAKSGKGEDNAEDSESDQMSSSSAAPSDSGAAHAAHPWVVPALGVPAVALALLI